MHRPRVRINSQWWSNGWSESMKGVGCTSWSTHSIVSFFQRSTFVIRLRTHFYRRKRSLGQGNSFAPVCHSVYRGEYLGRYCPHQVSPPRQVHPLQVHPHRDTPLQVHPLQYTPCRYTPRQIHPRGRYTPTSTPPAGTPPAGTPQAATPSRYNPRAGTHPQQVHPQGRYTPLAGTPPGQVHPPDRYTPSRYTPSRYTPLGRYTPRQIHPRGRYTPPEQCMLGDTGDKRAVGILLECILVQVLFTVLFMVDWCVETTAVLSPEDTVSFPLFSHVCLFLIVFTEKKVS